MLIAVCSARINVESQHLKNPMEGALLGLKTDRIMSDYGHDSSQVFGGNGPDCVHDPTQSHWSSNRGEPFHGVLQML